MTFSSGAQGGLLEYVKRKMMVFPSAYASHRTYTVFSECGMLLFRFYVPKALNQQSQVHLLGTWKLKSQVMRDFSQERIPYFTYRMV